VVFVSGTLLFWSEATSVIASPAWTFKWVFMVLAALNALYFECVLTERPELRDDAPIILPRSVRYAGIASLSLWTLVIVCGRLIAYLTSWP
jgi:hypothetical protein